MAPLLITVHVHQVRSAVMQQTGEQVSAETWQAKRIDDLFDIIETALAQRVHRISVSYDRVLGYPVSIHLDHGPQVMDGVIGYSARELRAVD